MCKHYLLRKANSYLRRELKEGGIDDIQGQIYLTYEHILSIIKSNRACLLIILQTYATTENWGISLRYQVLQF